MIVSQILRSKGRGEEVVVIAPDKDLAGAALLLKQHRIGCLVVSRGAALIDGVLSERDIVRALAIDGKAALDEPVSRYQTSKVFICKPEDTADEVLTMMTEHRFRHIPVVKDGAMIGLITQGDVVKARLSELSMEKSALEGMIMGY